MKVKRTAYIETVLSNFTARDFTLETTRLHAGLAAYLRKKGQLIGAYDLLIAATAIEHGFPLLTYNIDEFSKVPDLKIINPYD